MHCDVLIAGGGPAGLAAAIALRQKGIAALVVDALQPPIDKACGEGLMPDSLGVLARLGIFIPEEVGARFCGIAFISGNVTAVARFPRGSGVGLRRPRLHALLYERARELGVCFKWGTHVTLPAQSMGSDTLVRVGSEPCSFGLLVGADGQQSRVRSWSGLDKGSSVIRRFGRRRHFRLDRSVEDTPVEVYWGRSGQAYVTPVASNEIGVATVCRSAQVDMDELLLELPRLRDRLRAAEVASSLRGSVTTTRRLHHVTLGDFGQGGVALVGDASGSADAVTGEGLALAFREALLLADAIDKGSLASYEAGHPAILRQPRGMARVLLTLDRFPILRRRALNVLAADADLFSRLLALHVGDPSASRLTPKDNLRIGWRLLHSSAESL